MASCARTEVVGVCSGMCLQLDEGWERKIPATRTLQAHGEVFLTYRRANGEVIYYQQADGEDDLFHTDGRVRVKTYFRPKVGLTMNYIPQVFK